MKSASFDDISYRILGVTIMMERMYSDSSCRQLTLPWFRGRKTSSHKCVVTLKLTELALHFAQGTNIPCWFHTRIPSEVTWNWRWLLCHYIL